MDAFASPAQLVPGKKYFTHKLGLDLPFTDASLKMGHLSVNPDEILAESVEQRHFSKR